MKLNNKYVVFTVVTLLSIVLLGQLSEEVLDIFGYVNTFVFSVFIFAIVLNSRTHIRNKGIVFIGLSYIAIALFTFLGIIDLFNDSFGQTNFFMISKFTEIIVYIIGLTILFSKSKINVNKLFIFEGIAIAVMLIVFVWFKAYPTFTDNTSLLIFSSISHAILLFGYLLIISFIVLRRDYLDYDYRVLILIPLSFSIYELVNLIGINSNYANAIMYVSQIGGLVLFAFILYRLGYKNVLDTACKELEENRDRLLELSRIDELTMIANRRYLFENIDKAFRLAKRENHSISFLMIDIDDFKFYNDTFGHLHGDSVLVRVAKTIDKACKRPLDFVGRYGGEEFLAILPNSDYEGTLVVCKRILKEIQDLRIKHYDKEGAYLSVSIGFCVVTPDQDTNKDECLKIADRYLYKVKATGKNSYMGIDLDKGEEI